MKEEVHTLIGEGETFKGEIHAKKPIRIEGILQGKIIAESILWVGKKGKIEANIYVKEAFLAGEVEGILYAKTRAVLLEGCIFKGDIYSPKIRIEEGAILKGKLYTNYQYEEKIS